MECGMPNSEFGKQKTSVEQMVEVRKEEEQVRDLALIGIVQKWDKEKIPKCLDYFFLSNSPLSAFHTQYSSIPSGLLKPRAVKNNVIPESYKN